MGKTVNMETRIKTALSFVDVARSKDETRYFICSAYYNADIRRFASTDGWRLHFVIFDAATAELVGFKESGYYNIDKKAGKVYPIALDAQFPNIDKVIPEANVVEPSGEIDGGNMAADGARWVVKNGVAINFGYLLDLPKVEWSVSTHITKKSENAVVLGHIDGPEIAMTAVIMPMSLE